VESIKEGEFPSYHPNGNFANMIPGWQVQVLVTTADSFAVSGGDNNERGIFMRGIARMELSFPQHRIWPDQKFLICSITTTDADYRRILSHFTGITLVDEAAVGASSPRTLISIPADKLFRYAYQSTKVITTIIELRARLQHFLTVRMVFQGCFRRFYIPSSLCISQWIFGKYVLM
jgi:hypothetical protein